MHRRRRRLNLKTVNILLVDRLFLFTWFDLCFYVLRPTDFQEQLELLLSDLERVVHGGNVGLCEKLTDQPQSP